MARFCGFLKSSTLVFYYLKSTIYIFYYLLGVYVVPLGSRIMVELFRMVILPYWQLAVSEVEISAGSLAEELTRDATALANSTSLLE